LQAQTPHAEERQREGGTLYVQCPYPATTNQGWKAWCVLKNGRECLVYSHRKQSEDRRITVNYDPTARTMSVTMNDLRTEDSGTYFCIQNDRSLLKEISLNVFKGECHCACFGILPNVLGVFQGPSSTQPGSLAMSLSNVNIFILLSVVLSILLILSLITSVTLCVRLHKLLERTGNRGAEDIYDNSKGTEQLGSTGRRESSKDDSRGINWDLQSQPSSGDPLYCNIEPNPRNPRDENVEYAVVAFNQFPRNDTG
ncbi:PIGR protein, partial [Neodrepanis coruscans]|nr:PIGR protein [Neodrepanis coruscans]